ncbi:MAG: acyltransferase family protein [Acetobacteraceae bacterium]
MNRRTDLDALRIVLCASVILQHAILIYAAEPRYHVKSAEPVAWATLVYEALRIFAMPPFFAIAGWAAVVSLRRRTWQAFLHERLMRLAVPLLAGILLLGPAIKYIELTQGRDLGLAGFRLVPPPTFGFLAFLPQYYTRIVLTTWSHLWFLAYLLIYCVVLLPVLIRLARVTPYDRPPPAWSIYAPAVPLALVMGLFHGYWPYLPNLIHDWTNFAYFALCFLAGGLIAVWPGFERQLWKQAPGHLLLASIGFAGVVWFGESTVGRVMVGLTAWGFIGACWAVAHRMAPRPSATLQLMSEATLPVYILHHLPLLLIALWVLPLGWPVWLQIAVITGLSAAVSIGFYLVFVRPWRLPRWLLGMTPG